MYTDEFCGGEAEKQIQDRKCSKPTLISSND